jgi:hypothetical protein
VLVDSACERDRVDAGAGAFGSIAQEWARPVPVRPLARLWVGPADFPLLDRVRSHEDSLVLRVSDLKDSLFAESSGGEPLDDGYELRFELREGLLSELAEFAELQRAFYSWLDVLLEMVEVLAARIRKLEHEMERACRERHPVTAQLRQVPGVGPITALAYVLKVEDPTRFAKSREVGPFLALVPRERCSGENQPQLGIPPRGDAMLSCPGTIGSFGSSSSPSTT